MEGRSGASRPCASGDAKRTSLSKSLYTFGQDDECFLRTCKARDLIIQFFFVQEGFLSDMKAPSIFQFDDSNEQYLQQKQEARRKCMSLQEGFDLNATAEDEQVLYNRWPGKHVTMFRRSDNTKFPAPAKFSAKQFFKIIFRKRH